jgi:hypothetical protein
MSSRTWSFFVSALLVLAGCGGSDAPDASAAPDVGRDAAPTCTEDVDCEDGLFCNGEARCTEGRCVAGTPPACDDSLACTRDFCSEELRACVNRPADEDGDGHADAACVDARGTPLGDDCDDASAAIHPGAAELCDTAAVDEDCDPDTLGARDGDGDGFVDARCCNGASCGDDCNDAVRGASPTGTEVCNGIDDDCSGDVDEGVLVTVYRDADGDGHGDATMPRMACASTGGYSVHDDDCDDTSALRSPELFEACDGVDNDCDGTPDPADVPDVVSWYEDGDGDGFGDRTREVLSCSRPMGAYSLLGTDCDDANRAVHPAQAEQCNGVDDDCNGAADFQIAPGDLEDDDADGRPDAACTPRPAADRADCDDRDAQSGPGGAEICDGRDNDCDGSVDEGVEATPFFRDADGDGYGSETSGVIVGCGSATGYVERAGDCDDTNPDRHPTHAELCNGGDEDCDGTIDEELGAESCTSIETPRECIAGRCRDVLVCDAPTADCDALAVNGCESDLSSDPSRCGACDRTCRATEPGTVPICVASTCGLACVEGQDDCDSDLGRAMTGCETVLGTDANCGACGDACAATERCNPVTRSCEPVGGGCTYPEADCDMNGSCETDLSSDLLHCGSCLRTCSGGSAMWSCVAGSCRVMGCGAPMLNCDMNDTNGCETNGSTLTNCHACGRACAGMNATWTCGVADCEVLGCLGGFDDCDGLDATGCETGVGVDPHNCGMCGHDCYEPHAFAGCIAGSCGGLTCDAGYRDCNGNLGMGADGCEVMGTSCPRLASYFTWGGPGAEVPSAELIDVAVDASGNVYVVVTFTGALTIGSTTHSGAGTRAVVFSLDPSLSTVRWQTLANMLTGGVEATRLNVDGGSVVVVGSASGSSSLTVDGSSLGAPTSVNPFVFSLDATTGTFRWGRMLLTTGGATARALDVSGAGTVVFGGLLSTDLQLAPGMTISGDQDGWLARVSATDGTPIDIQLIGGTATIGVETVDVRDFDGDVFVGGFYSGAGWSLSGTGLAPGGGYDGWVARCTAGLMCGRVIAIATPADERVLAVRSGPGGHWVFGGTFVGSTTIGTTGLVGPNPGGFLAGVNYGPMGTIDWVGGHTSFGRSNGIRNIAFDGMNRVHVAFSGMGAPPGSFFGTSLSSTAADNAYTAMVHGDSGALLELRDLGPSTQPVTLLAHDVTPDDRVVAAGIFSATTVGGVAIPSLGVDQLVFRTIPY